MRSIFFTLSLAMAVPAFSTTAALADNHSCSQLRQTVINTSPATSRNRPWAALSCNGVSEIHLLLLTRHNNRVGAQIDATFRREGLIR